MYLGTLGRMIGIKCPVSQRVESPARYAAVTTLGGRSKAQLLPARDRVWDLVLGNVTTTEQTAVLDDFAQGHWGPGPFWFVSTEAPVTNLLTPTAASGDASTTVLYGVQGGPWETPEGLIPRSVLYPDSPADVSWLVNIPVLPGRPVTGSAILQGSNVRIFLAWYREDGSRIRSSGSPTTDGSHPVRVSVTDTPPEDAVYVRLITSRSVVRSARPQVTWTDVPVAWSAGRGCPSAVVLAGGSELVRTDHDGSTSTLESVSFVVQEVS